MTARNKEYAWRPEAIKLDKKIVEAMEPIMEKAFRMGFSVDSFYYIACNTINDMINCYVMDKAAEKEEKKIKEENSEQEKGSE